MFANRLWALLLAAVVSHSGLAGAAYTYNVNALSPGDTFLTLNSTGNGGSDSFAAVIRGGAGNPSVGVILLHGRGENTFDGHVILPLRIDLSARGYTTLSIDTPVPAPTLGFPNPYDYRNFREDATTGANYVFPELYARVRTATDELMSLGRDKAVLVGFSMGSRLGSAYMRYGEAGSIPIIGFVGVGMASDAVASLLDTPTSLAGVTVPVLDLYGSQDNATVLSSVADRLSAYSGPSYTQFQQIGAEHQWVGYEAELIGQVAPWLAAVAPVPEPKLYAMIAAGLALIVWRSRRRSRMRDANRLSQPVTVDTD